MSGINVPAWASLHQSVLDRVSLAVGEMDDVAKRMSSNAETTLSEAVTAAATF